MKQYTVEELRAPVTDSINAVKLVESTLARTRHAFSILFICLEHFQNHQTLIVEIISSSKAEDAAKLARFFVLQTEFYPKAKQRKDAKLNDEEYNRLLAEKRRIKERALAAYYGLQHHLFPDTKEAQIHRDKTARRTEIARSKRQSRLQDQPHLNPTTPFVILPMEPDPHLSDIDDDDDIADMNVDTTAKHVEPLVVAEEVVASILLVEQSIATIILSQEAVDPIVLADQPATPIFPLQFDLAVEQPLPSTFERPPSTMRTLAIPGLGSSANPLSTNFIYGFDSQSVAIDEDDRMDPEEDEVINTKLPQEQTANRLLRLKRRQSNVDDSEESRLRNCNAMTKASQLEYERKILFDNEIIKNELASQIAVLQKKKQEVEIIMNESKKKIIDLTKD